MYFIFLLRLTKIKITRTTKLILLSQSALSRIVTNMESSKCGALENVSAMMTVEGHIRELPISVNKINRQFEYFPRNLSKTFWFCRCRGLDEKFCSINLI